MSNGLFKEYDELRNSVPENTDMSDIDLSQIGFGSPEVRTGRFFDDHSKYDRGITYDEIISERGIEKYRHKEQPWVASLGSALNQAIIGEVVGGTIEGLGYLGDMPQYLQLTKGTEQEFGNWLSDIGKNIREWTQDTTPIYTDPFKEGEFAPEDWTWWMNNLPSVASSLSLMIPAGGAVKGLSMGAKMLNAGSKLSKGAKWATSGFTQAIMSRHMENLMEGAGTMEGIVSELSGATIGKEQADAISRNYGIVLIPDAETGMYNIDEQTANAIGAKAASGIYKADWAMLAQDIPQYMLLRTPFGKSTQEMTAGVAKFLGKDAIAPIAKKGAAITKDMLGEGFEEGYQYVVSEKARENALADAGIIERRDIVSSIRDYTKRGEFWTNAFFGSLGAGVMQTTGKGLSNAINRAKGIETIDGARITDLENSKDFFISYNATRNYGLETNNEALVTLADDIMVAKAGTERSMHGNLEPFIEMIEKQGQMTQEEMESLGLPENYATEAKKRNPELIKDLRKIGEYYDANVGVHGPQMATNIAREQFLVDKNSQRSNEYNNTYNKSSNEWNDGGQLSNGYKESFKIKEYQIPAIDAAIQTLENNKLNSRNDKDKIIFIDGRINKLKEERAELKSRSTQLLKDRSGNERLQDNVYRDAVRKTLKRGEKKLPVVHSRLAPKSEEALVSYANKITSDENVASSLFESGRFSDPKYQEKLEKSAKKTEKSNVTTNAKQPQDTPQDVQAQKDEAAGTEHETTVENAHNEQSDQEQSQAYNDAPIPKEYTEDDQDLGDGVSEDLSIDLNKYVGGNHSLNKVQNDLINTLNNSDLMQFDIDDAITAISGATTVEELQFILNANDLEGGFTDNIKDLISGYFTSLDSKLRIQSDNKADKQADQWTDPATIDNFIDPNALTEEEIDELNVVPGTQITKKKDGKVQRIFHYFKGGSFKDDLSFWATNYIPMRDGGEYAISKQIDRDGLIKGKYSIGDKIYFEINEALDHNLNDPKIRTINLVVYKNGKRNVVGTVPTVMQDPSMAEIRQKVFNDIDSKYESTGKIKQSKFTSKITGFSAKYNHTKARYTPSKIVAGTDSLSKFKDIGGFRLGYTKSTGSTMKWHVPQVGEAIEMGSSSKYAGQIGLVLENKYTGEPIPIFGFVKKLGSMASDPRVKDLKSNVWRIIQEADGTNDRELINRIKNMIILPKTYRKAGIETLKNNPDVYNKVFADSTLNIDASKFNNPIADIYLGKNQLYNEAINDFIEFNIEPNDYYSNVSALINQELVEDKEIDLEKERPIVNKTGINEQESAKIAEPIKPEIRDASSENEGNGTELEPKHKKRVRRAKTTGNTAQKLIDQYNSNKDNIRREKVARPNYDYTKKWDRNEELAWLKKNLPGVSVTTFNDLKEVTKNGKELWGVFKNASIYINDNAGTGTAYHEAFHAVFNLFLTEKEASDILSSYAKENGYKVPKTESEVIAIEEMIAEDFERYVLSQKKSKPSNFLARIFDRLLKLIGVAKEQSITDELFSKINTGFYSESKVKPGKFGSKIVRNKVAEWSAKHEKDVAQSINSSIVMSIIPDMQENGYIPKGFNTVESLDYAIKNDLLSEIYARVNDDLISLEEKATGEDLEIISDVIDRMYDNSGNYGKVINLSIRAFDYYNGIKISTKSAKLASETDRETQENLDDRETSYKENWMTGATERSAKDNVAQEIKDWIRYLRVPNEKNLLGLDKYVDYNSTYNKLLLDTAESTSLEEMINRLQFIYDSGINEDGEYDGYTPEYAQVIKDINDDRNLGTKFFNAFSKQHVAFTHVQRNDDGYIVYDANRVGVSNRIIKDWSNGILFNSKVVSTDKDGNVTIDTKKAKELRNELEGLQSKLTDANIRRISEITKEFGIEIPVESIRYAKEAKKTTSKIFTPLFRIFDKFASGVNPLDPDVDTSVEFKAETKSFKELADTVKYSKPSLYESSFRNVEGKTVYSHVVPNFLSTLVSKLTVSNPLATINHYRQDPIYANNIILNSLAKNLTSDKPLSEIFNFSILDGLNDDGERSWHTNMDTSDRLTLALSLFNNNGNKSYSKYIGPVLSDAPNQIIFNMVRLEIDTGDNNAVDEIIKLASSEYSRIQYQKEFKGDNPIDFFENGDTEYHIAPMFNRFKGDPAERMDESRKVVNKWLTKKSEEFKDAMIENKVLVYDKDGKVSHKESRLPNKSWNSNNIDAKISQFYANDFLMNASFSVLTVGDPAFYKPANAKNGDYGRSIDYYKRAKEIYSPKFIPDINAFYDNNGKIIKVRHKYNSVYLYDNNIKAPSYDAIKNALGNSQSAKAILSNYGEGRVNETDAQAYITLPFYRETMISFGRWNERYQDAYDRLEVGQGTSNDIVLVMQPIKPFVYGHVFDESREKIVPVQHKNSEYLLLPQFVEGNPVMEELLDKMLTDKIDVVNFESAVKVGASKKTTVSDLTSDDIHEMNTEDRGIQMETPEHFLDSNNLFGTQIRKLIMADLVEGVDYKVVRGKDILLSTKSKKLHEIYEDILLADLMESYDNAKSEFVDKDGDLDKKKISELLINESRSRGKGEDFEKAVELDENNEFRLPLFHPLHSKTAQSLLNSVFRNRVTKQKISGGAFIQASSFGLSEELKLVFDDNGGLSYGEILLPSWSTEFFKDFVDENGNIDFELAKLKLPDEVFNMIGYRIPTEDKYSMLPLKVVGFLPLEAGGAVMLPAEITTISGSDFDVDKMYIMMKEFKRFDKDGKIDYKVYKYDYDKSASKQNKQARNNAKIDIIKAVLSNPNTLPSIMNPGGFDKLKNQAATMVRNAENLNEINRELFGHINRVQISNDNMAGGIMIGIAANHNVHHALRQFSDLSIANPIKFNNKSGFSISSKTPIEQYSFKNGKIASEDVSLSITKNLAEFLAAVVDNAKDPVASSINYNEVTADVYSLIISSGFDTLTATAFMSQPIIKNIVSLVKKGDKIEDVINSVNKEYFNIKIDKNTKANNLNIKDLHSELGSIRFDSKLQKEVFRAFVDYQKTAKILGKLISVSRSDSKGLGASLADGEIVMSNKNNLLKSEKPLIIGMDEFLNGTGDTRFVKMFTEYGIERPMNDVLQKMFPYSNTVFSIVKSNIENNMSGGIPLSAKQRNLINDHFVNFYISRFDYFDSTNRKSIIEKFPREFFIYINNNKDLKSNKLINTLYLESKSKKVNIDRLVLNNTGGFTTEENTDMQAAWRDLFNSKHKDLGFNLVKYAYFTSGLGFGPRGFSHLVPVDAYLDYIKDSNSDTISEFMYKIQDLEYNEGMVNEFIDQFYRNMANNKAYVPELNDNHVISYESKDKKSFTIKAGANPSLVTDENTDYVLNITEHEYVPFISRSLDNVKKLYILESKDAENETATYIETNRLGIDNVAFEYLLNGGKSMETVFGNIKTKNNEYVSEPSVEEDIDQGGISTMDDLSDTPSARLIDSGDKISENNNNECN